MGYTKKFAVTLILPVYNGADFLLETLDRIHIFFSSVNEAWELLVVSDGSTDETNSIVETFCSSHSYARLISFVNNRGKGAAMKAGMAEAAGEVIICTDADLPYGLDITKQMVHRVHENPEIKFVYGARKSNGTGMETYGIVRKCGRLFFSYVTRFFRLTTISDTQCGIKLLSAPFARSVIARSCIDRFAFDIEMFVLSAENKISSMSVEVRLQHRKESSVRLFRDTIRMLFDMYQIRQAREKGRYRLSVKNNLLYIANIRLPTEKAHGYQIMQTCKTLADHGFDVELVIPNRKNYITEDPFIFYNLPRTFRIRRLPCLDLISKNYFGPIGFLIQSLTFFYYLKSYVGIQPVDYYYTRDEHIGYWLRKKVGTLYFEMHRVPSRIRHFHKKFWTQVTGVVVISDALRRVLLGWGVPEYRIILARDAVDPNRFVLRCTKEDARARLGLPMGQHLVVYTGHLYSWKGVDTLGSAAPFFKDSIRSYIVGGTVEDVNCFSRKYLTSNMHVVGWRHQEEIPYWLRAADVLVIPNSAKEKIGAVYTSPLKLFEYMISGTPIVASRVPALEEVVNDSNVRFFIPDDPQDLADAVHDVLFKRSDMWESRAGILAKIALVEYGWDQRGRRISSFLFNQR